MITKNVLEVPGGYNVTVNDSGSSWRSAIPVENGLSAETGGRNGRRVNFPSFENNNKMIYLIIFEFFEGQWWF
jgi:hypothetical protein